MQSRQLLWLLSLAWSLALSGAGFAQVKSAMEQSSAEKSLSLSPTQQDQVVRAVLPNTEILWTDTAVFPVGKELRVVAYVNAGDWEGFVQVLADAASPKLLWQLRLPMDPTSGWLQVSNGWTLEDLDGDELPEAIFQACMPHACCLEFGVAILSTETGWLIQQSAQNPEQPTVHLRSLTPLPPRLLPWLQEHLATRLCPPANLNLAHQNLAEELKKFE